MTTAYRYESTLGDEYLKGIQEMENSYERLTEPKSCWQLVEYLSDLEEYSKTSSYMGPMAAHYLAWRNGAADAARRRLNEFTEVEMAEAMCKIEDRRARTLIFNHLGKIRQDKKDKARIESVGPLER